jgi:uncharacterized protein YbjT (DUF2867 family)
MKPVFWSKQRKYYKEIFMKILVTGATGNVGRLLVKQLIDRGTAVRIFTRKQPQQNQYPNEVEVAVGDLLDPDSVANAMKGIDKLFLLNAVSPSELTEALIGFGIARRVGVRHITYLSVFKANEMKAAPHMATKFSVENAIRESDISFTILRPNYFMQNDAGLKPVIAGMGFYPMPLGPVGVSAVDIRDIAEAGAISLTEKGHEGQTYDLVGPTAVTGPSNAEVWSKLLGKPVIYAGHDLDRWENQVRSQMPSWMAFDVRTMFEGFFAHGYTATATEVGRLTKLLGHAPRSYEAFATEIATDWAR